MRGLQIAPSQAKRGLRERCHQTLSVLRSMPARMPDRLEGLIASAKSSGATGWFCHWQH
jgi:hypothetical protein